MSASFENIRNFDFSGLNAAERIPLAEALWDSVYETANPPLTPAIAEELDRRMAAEDAGEMEYFSWEEVKAGLLKR